MSKYVRFYYILGFQVYKKAPASGYLELRDLKESFHPATPPAPYPFEEPVG